MSISPIIIGDFTVARPNGGKEWKSYGPDNSGKYFTQAFVQLASKRQLLPLNSVYNAGGEVLSNYYLVGESDAQDLGGGIVQWERTYAPIFADHVEYEQYAFAFPLMPFSSTVPLRGYNRVDAWDTKLVSKHFLVGTSIRDRTPFTNITTPDDIPILSPVPIVDVYGATTNDLTLAYHSPIQNPELVPDAVQNTDGNSIAYGTIWISGSGYSIRREDYEAFVTSGRNIVIQSSVIKRVFGNLWVRVTRYAQAR